MGPPVSHVVDDAEFLRRQRLSQRAFHRGLAARSPGSRTILEGDALQATIIPDAPRVALLNAVLYDDPSILLGSLDQIAQSYREAGVDNYAVWVPGRERDTARSLRDAGHRRVGVFTISIWSRRWSSTSSRLRRPRWSAGATTEHTGSMRHIA
jgi:hypothetical protein